MTPKEKAKTLINNFYNLRGFDWDMALNCSLIAVDEMLNEYPNQCPKDSYEYKRHLYWLEVKSEIEKL